jgi:NDP-sugar pyrophosphorylase family protein
MQNYHLDNPEQIRAHKILSEIICFSFSPQQRYSRYKMPVTDRSLSDKGFTYIIDASDFACFYFMRAENVQKNFFRKIINDLNYPLFESLNLFKFIEKPEQIGDVLSNTDYLVKEKINSCPLLLEGTYQVDELIKEGLIKETSRHEIEIVKPFALKGSIIGHRVTIEGLVYLGEEVVIGRSTIIGPCYLSQACRLHDSKLYGGDNGSVYIGKKSSVWDFSVIIRSFIGDNSLIHTCNIDDSIIGPNCNFGAIQTIVNPQATKNRAMFDYFQENDYRTVLCNFRMEIASSCIIQF